MNILKITIGYDGGSCTVKDKKPEQTIVGIPSKTSLTDIGFHLVMLSEAVK